ncbi:MAG: helix-turn-helix domain-containing protein, partial [Candidatus Accumulibacter sp.]|nr:helix-turn-helix domain-containing protein [Accumulibacter sp.]
MNRDDDWTDESSGWENAGESPAREGDDADAPPFVSPSIGLKLRTAREARGLTVVGIAKALKLSASQVEALEADDWRHLPGNNTIIRGFVRNYARFLDMETSELMSLLDKLHIHEMRELKILEGMNVGVSSDKKIRFRDYLPVITGLVVLIAAILLYFLLPDSTWQSMVSSLRSVFPAGMKSNNNAPDAENRKPLSLSVTVVPDTGAQAQTRTSPATPAPRPQPSAPTPPPVPPAPNPPPPEPPKAPPAPPAVVSLVAPPPLATATLPPPVVREGSPEATPTTSAPAASASGLTFDFLEGAWVEVRNRNNKVVFSGMNQAGTRQ